MARFPQIPAPEFGSRRGAGEMPEAIRLPGIEETIQPFRIGAEAVGEAGTALEQAEARRQVAAAALQEKADKVTATKMNGDHDEKLNNLHDQLAKQFIDTPDKMPDEFRRQSLAMSEDERKNAPNPQVGQFLQQQNIESDNRFFMKAHGWMTGRIAQKAKSDFTDMEQGFIRKAQAQGSIQAVAMTLAGSDEKLGSLRPDLKGDPDVSERKFKHDAVMGYFEANSPMNPLQVGRELDAAIKTGKGPAAEWIDGKERASLQKKAMDDLKNFGETQQFQFAKESHDESGKAYQLLLKGDLNSKNLVQLQNALDAKIDSTMRNPVLKENPSQQQRVVEGLNREKSTLHYYDDIMRKPDHYSPVLDEDKSEQLIDSYLELMKAGAKGPQDLENVLKFREQLAEAEAKRWVQSSRASTMQRGLIQLTGTSLSKEARNTGWDLRWAGGSLYADAHQSGNRMINELLATPAGKKIPKAQQNQIRINYIEKLVTAQEDKRNPPDTAVARQIAQDVFHQIAGYGGQ